MATFNTKTHKKCIRCKQIKPKADIVDPESGAVVEPKGFGTHGNTDDGLQVICYACKNKLGAVKRNQNVRARLRHHTSTRCLTQLGDAAPPGFVADLEDHLGYRISQLVKHLGHDLKMREGPHRKLVDALNEGYHVDHIHPLSRFSVVDTSTTPPTVDWEAFRACWAMKNLRAIPAQENLIKGAKVTTVIYDDIDSPPDSDSPDDGSSKDN